MLSKLIFIIEFLMFFNKEIKWNISFAKLQTIRIMSRIERYEKLTPRTGISIVENNINYNVVNIQYTLVEIWKRTLFVQKSWIIYVDHLHVSAVVLDQMSSATSS